MQWNAFQDQKIVRLWFHCRDRHFPRRVLVEGFAHTIYLLIFSSHITKHPEDFDSEERSKATKSIDRWSRSRPAMARSSSSESPLPFLYPFKGTL